MSESVLTSARYGKDLVRVFRVVKGKEFHQVVEYNVTVLLEGDIETSYTVADNSVVVATDSIKNITYYLAKISPHILSPERFALHLGTYLVSKYAHIHRAFVSLEKLRWSRITLSGNVDPHPHSAYHSLFLFFSPQVDASAGKDKLSAKVTSGITDLLVLKSTGSAIRQLPEVTDRVLSTSVDLAYTFKPISLSPPTDAAKLEFNIPENFTPGSVWDGDAVTIRARNGTLDIFSLDESASVQRVIAENAGVESVVYKLPNKHYIPVNMNYIGVDNTANAEVFTPTSAPSGLISATISRK
ncbi:hypothetical protein EDD22DRAFT_979069 [Suillus occidentalis]|nr:hypothetical protein EDD22DRAFT_979069 [Suillus occidentalis]